VEKKEAEPPEVSNPATLKSEKPTDALPYMKNTYMTTLSLRT
jgi:hypothetical protein